MKIVVIIPTYNEKVNMEKMIPILLKDVFPKITNHTLAILVADDKSPDGTADVIREYKKQYKNLELLTGDKKGLGAAYARAMPFAMDAMKADAIIEFDADFQHDPQDIPRLVAAMDKGADHVIGSRYVPGGAIPKEWGLHRKMLSYFGSNFARLVWLKLDVHDMTSGYKLTKSEFLKKFDFDKLLSKYYAYKLHMLHDMLKFGANVKEVPIIFYERKEGSSKISRKDFFDSLYVVSMLRIQDSKRLVKFLFVGGTGFLLQLLVQEGSISSGFSYFLANLSLQLFHPKADLSALGQSIGAGLGAETAILSNFFFNNYWTFSDTKGMKGRSKPLVRLLKFNSASLAAIFIQSAAVWLGIKAFGNTIQILNIGVPTRIAIVIPTIIFLIIPMNYLIYNKLIWKTQHLKNGNTKKT